MGALYLTQKAIFDEQNRIYSIKEQIEEAREQGLEQGLEQGRMEEKKEMARMLLALGDPLDKIIKVTGLSVEELEELKRTLN